MSSNRSQFNTRRRQRYEGNGSSIRREVVSSWKLVKARPRAVNSFRRRSTESLNIHEFADLSIYQGTPGWLTRARVSYIFRIYVNNPFIDASLANGIELGQSTWESSERNNVSNLIIFSFIFSLVFVASFRRFPVFLRSSINVFCRKFITIKK